MAASVVRAQLGLPGQKRARTPSEPWARPCGQGRPPGCRPLQLSFPQQQELGASRQATHTRVSERAGRGLGLEGAREEEIGSSHWDLVQGQLGYESQQH